MSWLILIAGIVGLSVAGYGFIVLTIGAVRHRQYLDIILAVVVVLVVVSILIAEGDRLLR